MKIRNNDLLRGPLFSGVISYTVPIILTSVLQLLFNAADLVVVGRFCGSLSVAAVGATGALTNLIINLFIGLSVGVGVTVAHGLGSGDQEDVHRTIHTALPAALVCGLVLTVVGVAFAGSFLEMMDTPENVLPLSTVYMQIYFAGMTFTMVYNFCTSILRAAGDVTGPFVYLTIAGVINVALNVLFVTQFRMNVAGVALATTLSQGVSAVLVVLALMRRSDVCRLEWKKMRFYGRQLSKILRIGLPAGMQSSMFAISNVVIQSTINSFGDTFVSGNSAATNIEGFVYVIMNSFSQTTVNYVGQNSGARQYRRVRQVFWLCMACVCVVGIVCGGAAYLAGEALLSVYITDSQEAIACGMIRMAFVCLPYFLCGIMEIPTAALRGLGYSIQPMLISVLGACVFRIVWIYAVFPLQPTPQCLLFSYPVSWILTFVAQLIVFVFVYRRVVGGTPEGKR